MPNRLNKVVRELRGRILRGEIKAGQRITETAAADMLGVSRTPVRLAFSILEQEDLVEGEPNKGFKVLEFSFADYEQTIAIRAELEGMAVRLATQQGLPHPIEVELDEIIERTGTLLLLNKLTEESLIAYGRLNWIFHERLITASGNRWLYRMLERAIPTRYRSAPLIFDQDPDKAYELIKIGHTEHIELLEAIKGGESSRAEFLMREHVQTPNRYLKKLLKDVDSRIDIAAEDIRLFATRERQ